MSTTTDRRVKYTKMVLRESLIKKLRDKPIARITIKELCEDADINRTTFYAHYTDQFDLLNKIQDAFIADINSYLDQFALESGDSGMLQLLSKIFEYIAQNDELCRVLLGSNGVVDFQTKVMQIVSTRIVVEWRKKQQVDEATAQYIYTYVATGSIGVIRKWLLDTNPKSPQEMAHLVVRMVYKGIEQFIL
ncbi:MAG TPA: TetR/AcrR family transcriptional regulator [Firmicutes bacterium]|mgnify:CR=1 FL=1|jgi:AcrR family transcriptional regulator|nr:TetR/AcrR family transcriptional regulator [Bacillota bacterium]HAZ22381.1 TetR/AcrR family transcriptional regulator [Bacillota bacterium]HBE05005.1 TetR/AcrR family transcriptional regulator [Bacillota bacterium]HBL49219.1 TetR/AcrR family transcriptional regulator [Bacillota bacterium]HBL69579.1 TetR/AcrR family transcriptional regulator [Bacillota bacterium]